MADFLSTLFGGGAEQEAAQKDIAAANQYQGQGLGALQTGYTTGSQAINSAIGGYQPLANLGATYASGAPTLMGALGVGTPDQVAAARSAFTASPGYDYSVGQGLQALARQNPNMSQSSNAQINATTLGQNLANQDYQQWVNNLMQTGGMGINATGTAAAGQAGQYDALANLASQYAQNQTGVYGNTMSTTVGANNLQAAGEAAGAKNLLNAGLSIAGMVMNPLGSLGSGAGSTLSGMASGLSPTAMSPSYGGGNIWSGDAYGGSSLSPLPGLSPEDYGQGY